MEEINDLSFGKYEASVNTHSYRKLPSISIRKDRIYFNTAFCEKYEIGFSEIKGVIAYYFSQNNRLAFKLCVGDNAVLGMNKATAVNQKYSSKNCAFTIGIKPFLKQVSIDEDSILGQYMPEKYFHKELGNIFYIELNK